MIGRTQLSVVEHDEEIKHLTPEQISADETEIRRIVDEIDNLCDAKNWQKLRELFADEVEIDFTSIAGGEPSTVSADELVGAWERNLYAEKKTFHQRTNHRIETDGDRAFVFSKGYAFNLLETGEVTGLWEIWANYTHNLKLTESGWRVSGMTLDVVHQRGDERVRTFVPEK
jgi:hypothetical protein